MPHRMLALAMFVALGLLVACGATRHSLGRPAGEVAVVKGSSFNPLQVLGVNSMITVQSVDGQDLKQGAMQTYPKEVEVLPGHHLLGIYYSFHIDSSPGPSGNATLEFDAVAGKSYKIRERFGSAGQVAFTFEEEPAR